MTEAGAGLPDPDVLQRVARLVGEAAPVDWLTIDYTVWYEAGDVFGSSMVVTGTQGGPLRVAPPDADLELDDLRSEQVAAGQEPWLRCDLRLRRRGAQEFEDIDMSCDFSYDVGVVPG